MTKPKKEGGQGGERVAYGIAAITRTLQGVDFPADKHTLAESIRGREHVHWTKEMVVDLRELLESLPDQQIRSITELTHLVNERLHQKTAG